MDASGDHAGFAPAAADQSTELQITICDMEFVPSVLELSPGQTVECVSSGVGGLHHSVEILCCKSNCCVAESLPVRPGKSWRW